MTTRTYTLRKIGSIQVSEENEKYFVDIYDHDKNRNPISTTKRAICHGGIVNLVERVLVQGLILNAEGTDRVDTIPVSYVEDGTIISKATDQELIDFYNSFLFQSQRRLTR